MPARDTAAAITVARLQGRGGNPEKVSTRCIAMREAGSHHPSPLGAATASATFPGWGQIRVGRRRMGLALITATALFITASVVAVVDEGAFGVLGWLVDPDFLLALVLANLMFAALRVWAATHAWVTAGGRLASLTLIVVVLVVSIPHVAVSYYGLHTRSSLMTLFPTPPEPGPVLEPETTTTLAPTTTMAATSSRPHHTLVPPMTIPTSSTALTTTIALPLGT
ncbi:MAG: hypothetical protein ACRDZM_13595, partial [Acidimicrobiia bacterium]